jgi:hypothetical protein
MTWYTDTDRYLDMAANAKERGDIAEAERLLEMALDAQGKEKS